MCIPSVYSLCVCSLCVYSVHVLCLYSAHSLCPIHDAVYLVYIIVHDDAPLHDAVYMQCTTHGALYMVHYTWCIIHGALYMVHCSPPPFPLPSISPHSPHTAWPSDEQSNMIIAQRQADKALELLQGPSMRLQGPVQYIHTKMDMRYRQVAQSEWTREGMTCPPAMGHSFAAVCGLVGTIQGDMIGVMVGG